MVIGFNDSGSFAATALGPGNMIGLSFNGWSQSTNAGASYTDRGILTAGTLPPDVAARDLLGDPVVRCSSTRNFYHATLMTQVNTASAPVSAIAVLPSTDGGTTFAPAVVAAGKDADTHMLDKPWMAVAPGPTASPSDDVLNVTYTDFDFSFTGLCPTSERIAIEQVRSTDGGATWSNLRAAAVNFPAIEGRDLFFPADYMGDYNSIATDRLGRHPGAVLAWGDNALGDPNVAQRKQRP